MRYLTFSEPEPQEYEICLLVPSLRKQEIQTEYITPHIPSLSDRTIAYELSTTGKKTSATHQREYLDELLPVVKDLGVRYLVVADAGYFKTLTKQTKAEPFLGYVLPCALDSTLHVAYIPNYTTVFYDPEKVRNRIGLAFQAIMDHRTNSYTDPGSSIIKFADYPKTVSEIRSWLNKLKAMNVPLAADIEGFSLKHYEAGIGTISFAWNKHEGIAFPVDLLEGEGDAKKIRNLLKEFFYTFSQKLVWHNISYDVYVLIYQLFMKDLLDTKGLIEGLGILLSNWDDTKLITYLATNSCAGNQLGLKAQAQEFAGNYAVEEITDITKIPLDELLQYNLVDSLSTWYVYEKHYQTMVDDNQLQIYETLFKDAIVDIIQMQLTGLPLNMETVKQAQIEMQQEEQVAIQAVLNTPLVQHYSTLKKEEIAAQKNLKYKKKRVTAADIDYEFNLNSPDQLQELLYKIIDLPVIEYTKSKQPATGKDVLDKLLNITKDPEIKSLLSAIIDFKAVNKILTAFIPAMLSAPQAPDGWHYLYGNFNLGGTVSGRLSSSKPNLQNLPATKSKYAKIIKKCFQAPPGWHFAGLDFNSLEDRISALTTKDPNKIKVYTDGYDGHCLRAYSYFGEHMPDIDPNSVESINSIDKKYKSYRQESKSPTFALTYQGTYLTLIKNCGFTEELARTIEERYHILYKVSDDWVADKLDQASKDGYVTVAFDLRVRTPLLHQVILGNRKTPFEAEAEGRTAGNALGQSWCLLNSRAASEFMKKVRNGFYRYDIKPCAHIHDAQYYLIRDDIKTLGYMNQHLVEAVRWQEDPLIAHDEVKLGGEVSVFYPTWAEEISLPNDAKESELLNALVEHHNKLKEKGLVNV
jgi:DNA polymerase-1